VLSHWSLIHTSAEDAVPLDFAIVIGLAAGIGGLYLIARVRNEVRRSDRFDPNDFRRSRLLGGSDGGGSDGGGDGAGK
jgi:hypothetical protein